VGDGPDVDVGLAVADAVAEGLAVGEAVGPAGGATGGVGVAVGTAVGFGVGADVGFGVAVGAGDGVAGGSMTYVAVARSVIPQSPEGTQIPASTECGPKEFIPDGGTAVKPAWHWPLSCDEPRGVLSESQKKSTSVPLG
jgi:hypothetical protein